MSDIPENPFDIPSDPIASQISTPTLTPSIEVPEGNPFATMTGGVQNPNSTPNPIPQPTANTFQQPSTSTNTFQQQETISQPNTFNEQPMNTNTGFSGFNEQAPTAQPQQGFGNNQGGFGGNNFGGNSGGNNQKRKYKFVQMYWLINPKLFAQQQLGAGEAPLIEISYNVDYSNLRLSFIKTNESTFSATAIKVQNTDRATTVNIYAETADQVLYYLEKGITGQIQLFERMIQANATWTPNKSIITIAQDGSVTIMTQPSSGNATHSYTFTTWQVESLKKALKFLTEGSSYIVDIAKFLAPSEG